jgi:hypothetical protein
LTTSDLYTQTWPARIRSAPRREMVTKGRLPSFSDMYECYRGEEVLLWVEGKPVFASAGYGRGRVGSFFVRTAGFGAGKIQVAL